MQQAASERLAGADGLGADGLGDAELARLARRGEASAFGAIMSRYNRRLYRAARSVLRDDGEAEDAVQDAYVRAFTGLSEFRGEAGLSTWLTRITINEALGRLRRRRRSVDLQALDAVQTNGAALAVSAPLAMADADPERTAARREIRRLIEQAIDELPEAFRLVFVLRDVEEMSVEETAAHLGLRPETVKTRLFRARRRLRRALNDRLASALTDAFPFAGARCARVRAAVLRRLGPAGPPAPREDPGASLNHNHGPRVRERNLAMIRPGCSCPDPRCGARPARARRRQRRESPPGRRLQEGERTREAARLPAGPRHALRRPEDAPGRSLPRLRPRGQAGQHRLHDPDRGPHSAEEVRRPRGAGRQGRPRLDVLQRRPPRRGEAALPRGALARVESRRVRAWRRPNRMPSRGGTSCGSAGASSSPLSPRRGSPLAGERRRDRHAGQCRWLDGLVRSDRGPGAARPDDPVDQPRPRQRAHHDRLPPEELRAPPSHPGREPSRGTRITCCRTRPSPSRRRSRAFTTSSACPHEHAGMVGRIVVGRPAGPGPSDESARPVPEAARRAFPAVEEILQHGTVRRG